MERRGLHIFVRGRVQGVGYRMFVVREAEALGLGGWTRNLADGRVEIVAAGAAASLEQFVGRLQSGPPHARVEGLERTVLEPPPAFEGFGVRG